MRLVFSSLGFIVPCVIAIRKRRIRHAMLSAALTCTSVLNHATTSVVLRVIDVTYVHALFLHFVRLVQINKVSGICLYLTPYIYYTKCRRDDRAAMNYHVMMHVLGILGWSSYLSKN